MNRCTLALSRIPCVSVRNTLACISTSARGATNYTRQSLLHTSSSATATPSWTSSNSSLSASSNSSSSYSGSFASLFSTVALSVTAAAALFYESQQRGHAYAADNTAAPTATSTVSASSHSSSPSSSSTSSSPSPSSVGSPSQSAVDNEVLRENQNDLLNEELVDLEEKSELPFTNPNVPGVSYVTANDLLSYLQYHPNRVNGVKPVLLFVTEDGCSACARLKPVILQLADSAEESKLKQFVILATQDGDRNYSKALFSKEEALAVPRIKLFQPANSPNASFTAVEYDGRYNCVALSEWLAQQLGKNTKIPLEEMKSACVKRDPQTVAKVSDASRASLSNDLLSSLYARSPCGSQTTAYIIALMSRSYASSRETSAVSDVTLESLFNAMNECSTDKEELVAEYWKSIEDTAKENLVALKEKSKSKSKEKKEKKD